MGTTKRCLVLTRVSALVLVIGSLSSCESAAPADPCRLRVGFVMYEGGRIDDGGFNGSAWNGVLAATAALGLPSECAELVGGDSADEAVWGGYIDDLVADGVDIIVTSGFTMTEGTRAAGRRHPGVRFIGTDQFQEDTIANVAGIVFHEDVGGFLAGALAGLVTETDVVGVVLGCRAVPPVSRFGIGFWNGARHVNPDVAVLAMFHEDDFATCFNDAAWGAMVAADMVTAGGADVIFGAGGSTGNGAIVEACMQGATVIGVDFDQYQTLPEVRPCIVSSSTKSIVSAVADLILSVDQGRFPSGNYFGGSTLAPFHDRASLVSSEDAAMLEDIQLQLEAGTLDPCMAVPELPEASAISACTPIGD